MATRYLEINSSYRDRENYKNQSEFDVIIGNYMENTLQLTSFPQYTFNNNQYGPFYSPLRPYSVWAAKEFLNGEIASPSLPTSSAVYSADIYPTYTSYMMFGWLFSTSLKDARIIKKYNENNNTYTISIPLSLPVSASGINGTGLVFDPSPCKTIGDPDNSATWNTPFTYYNIQSFSNIFNQYPVLTQSTYVGSYLMYEGEGSSNLGITLYSALGVPEGKIITGINTETLQITIDSPFSYTSGSPPDMFAIRQFSIRKTLPVLVGNCTSIIFTNNVLDLGT